MAAGFPSGQTPLETKLAEIKLAVEYGAREIDIVISRSLVLTGQWEGKYPPFGKELKPVYVHVQALSLSLSQSLHQSLKNLVPPLRVTWGTELHNNYFAHLWLMIGFF